MPDRFTLLSLSLSLILQNVCCGHNDFSVSAPLNHTLNEDGSITVTCEHDKHETWGWEAKLKMNKTEVVCEVFDKKTKEEKCDWEHEDNKFKFTLKRLEARHKYQLFSCEISKIQPLPILTIEGKETKLFQGSNIPFPPPMKVCSCPSQISEPTNCPPTDMTSLDNKYTFLICGLIIVVVLLSLYSTILTGVYVRLRKTKVESPDTFTYVPMQRKVKQRDADNTEYEDMREVQKQERPIRDMNHNC